MFAWGFLCASLAIVADLALTLVVHFLGDSSFAAVFFIVTAAGSVLLGLAGIVLGILGRGTPRLASLAWSSGTLASVALTPIATVSQL